MYPESRKGRKRVSSHGQDRLTRGALLLEILIPKDDRFYEEGRAHRLQNIRSNADWMLYGMMAWTHGQSDEVAGYEVKYT
jgi:hypothetical protein